jgi:pimeloyl-ACP methyl ester carboxylesterase
MPRVANNQKIRRSKTGRKIVWLLVLAFIGMNIVACIHAYTFTHFTHQRVSKTKDARALSATEKIKTLLLGINNPRPVNIAEPQQDFETVRLNSYKSIELWQISKGRNAKGTVILFHGYSGCKSGLLDKSDEFLKLGYNTVLVDFPGSGGSAGNQTTIGYKEAAVVRDCYNYLRERGEDNIYLFGTSMGAAAILKSFHDYRINPSGIILECPFGTMYESMVNRFYTIGVPAFPFAPLLVLWGGVLNGFWAFSHNPANYARHVQCPTLLMYGTLDEKVAATETSNIYRNLNGAKKLITFPRAGHENYLLTYKKEWTAAVANFLLISSAVPAN